MALENEWVENDIRSLCTNSIGLVACKALPLEKDSNVVCQERNLEKLRKCKILWEDQKQNLVCSIVENAYSSYVQIFHAIAYSNNEEHEKGSKPSNLYNWELWSVLLEATTIYGLCRSLMSTSWGANFNVFPSLRWKFW